MQVTESSSSLSGVTPLPKPREAARHWGNPEKKTTQSETKRDMEIFDENAEKNGDVEYTP